MAAGQGLLQEELDQEVQIVSLIYILEFPALPSSTIVAPAGNTDTKLRSNSSLPKNSLNCTAALSILMLLFKATLSYLGFLILFF